MPNWNFSYIIITRASMQTAWDFLTDMQNQVKLEPGITAIEFDGPFETGTVGRTITREYTQEWVLSDVLPYTRFVITGKNADFTLSFTWEFESIEHGTRLHRRIDANGTDLSSYDEIFRQMENTVPGRLEQLALELDREQQEKEDQ